jgi:hypothetical protein
MDLGRYSIAAALLAALAVAAACAQASVVTVSPESMAGWTMTTNMGATNSLATYGAAVYERANPWSADDGTNLGRGAYYATLDGGGWDGTPPTAWLGLDTFNGSSLAGVTLSRITALQYYAYVGHIPNAGSATNWDSWKGYHKYPRQPISLQITAEHPTSGSRKQFWFVPWVSGGGEPVRGDNCGQNCKKWLRYDCINFNNPGPSTAGVWYSPENPEEKFASWSALVAAYGSYKLVATSNDPWPTGYKSPGWDSSTTPAGAPSCTATGKCINFEIGGRKTLTHIFFTDGITWTNDYLWFKGYVDLFTLGIDGTNVTYNFEPAANAVPPRVVATNNDDAYDSITRNPSFQNERLTKVFGKITYRNAAVCKLDDGAGRVIECILYKGTGLGASDGQNPTYVDEYWSIWGYLDTTPFGPSTRPLCIWTAPEHMVQFD